MRILQKNSGCVGSQDFSLSLAPVENERLRSLLRSRQASLPWDNQFLPHVNRIGVGDVIKADDLLGADAILFGNRC